MAISGLKLNFKEDGEIEVESGKKQLPHRVELIEQAFAEKKYDLVASMIFNFKLRDCRHATNIELLNRESKICDQLIEIMETREIA